jgi:hypothetical protein
MLFVPMVCLTVAIVFWSSLLPPMVWLWLSLGKFHDQGDAKWIVIRGQLRGHNDTPFVFGGLSYYYSSARF